MTKVDNIASTANAGIKREGKSIAIGLVPFPTKGGGAVAVTADRRTALQVRCIFLYIDIYTYLHTYLYI
jgi:hypothetical protein